MSLVDAFLLEPAPLNIWIAKRTDGLKGSGTANDPYDGSKLADGTLRFDQVLNLFQSQSNVTILLGPGEFETKGYLDAGGGWQVRPGMKIIGSGMDVTTLKLVPGTTAIQHFAIGHNLASAADAVEVRDLTIDCNLEPSGVTVTGACGGLRVMGNHTRIERVKVINWGTKSATVACFVLSLIVAYPGTAYEDIVNAGMEGCIATNPGNGSASPVIVLHVGSTTGTFTKDPQAKSPCIRNCFVDCGITTPNADPTTGKYRAMSMAWCRGGVVEGNHVHNTDIGGPYQDQRGVKDLIVRNNFYKNVARGPFLNLGQVGSSIGHGNLTVSGSVATIAGVLAGDLSVADLYPGDRVRLPAAYDGIYQVRTLQQSPAQFTIGVPAGSVSASISSVQRIVSIGRAIIEGNTIELAPVTGATAIEVHDNNTGVPPMVETPDYFHGDIIIRNNKIRWVDGLPPADTGVKVRVAGAKNAIVKDNIIDTIATHPLENERCGSGTLFNNRAPGGLLLRGWNKDLSRYYDELETEAEDALVMSLFNKR